MITQHGMRPLLRASSLCLALVIFAGCPKQKAASAAAEAASAAEAAAEAEARPVESAEVRVERAIALLTRETAQDARKAADILESVLKDDPNNAYAKFNLGVAWHQLGDAERAAFEFNRVTRVLPEAPEGWLYGALLLQEAGDHNGAVSRLRRGVEAAPEDIELRVALVAALRSAGRPADAVKAAKEALRVNSRHLPLLNEMGLAYLDLNETEMALFVYESAAGLGDGASNAVIQANHGWALYKSGERFAAKAMVSSSLEVDPDFVPAMVYLAQLHMDDRNYVDTVPLLEKAIASGTPNAGLYLTLGLAYRGVERYDEAKKAYKKALELDPSFPDPHFNLGVLLADYVKDYDAGIAALRAYVKAGGSRREQAKGYIALVEREKARAERSARAAQERAQREAERAERERLLKEAEAEKAAKEAGAADKATAPTEVPGVAPSAPDGEEPDPESPWGEAEDSAEEAP